MSIATKKSRISQEPHEAVVNLRVPLAVRDLIDNAATMLGKTRTAFMIESSRKEAIDVMLDQRLFTLDGKQFDAFAKALDETPASNAKLRRLMSSQSPWEK
ncbi:MAG TPA: DUF1778 domain-containing protein [Rhizomicrobium sp.]|jgi:uncharacterized protein (DUF1778 family)|nr:DUF1778 domain-containing protein [Rhizomicrobium sp.]